jgi:hypothetical protein
VVLPEGRQVALPGVRQAAPAVAGRPEGRQAAVGEALQVGQ